MADLSQVIMELAERVRRLERRERVAVFAKATATTTHTPTLAKQLLECNAAGGAFTVTYPAANATSRYQEIIARKVESSANTVTVNDGTYNWRLTYLDDTVYSWCDGNAWYTMDLRRRVSGVHATSNLVSGETILTGATFTSASALGSNGVPLDALGVILTIEAEAAASGSGNYLAVDSADDTPDQYSNKLCAHPSHVEVHTHFVRLGTGVNAGKIKIKAVGTDFTNVSAWVVGWWR